MRTTRTTSRRKGPPTPRIKAGRVEDPAHLARVRSLPCIACEISGTAQTTPTESHHIRRDSLRTCYGKGQKAGDHEAIPLCKLHHWNGSVCQCLGWSLASFEAKYGNERDLLVRTLEALKTTEAA
jgi:hypothetical protein